MCLAWEFHKPVPYFGDLVVVIPYAENYSNQRSPEPMFAHHFECDLEWPFMPLKPVRACSDGAAMCALRKIGEHVNFRQGGTMHIEESLLFERVSFELTNHEITWRDVVFL
jgi:hypothetical protein